jgi:hypothetical protein
MNAKKMLEEDGGIRLLKEDNDGKLILFTKEPNMLPLRQLRNLQEIMEVVGGFFNLQE